MTNKLFSISSEGYNLTELPEHPVYPARQRLEKTKTHWNAEAVEYAPEIFTHPSVLDAEGKWADSSLEPSAIMARELIFSSVRFDKKGYPLNPHGRTGLAGRGLLGRYGPNLVADTIVTNSNLTHVLAVQRPNDMWALPGGFIEEDEHAEAAARRETREETGINIGRCVLRQVIFPALYIPNNRITDNAWIETVPFAVIIDNMDDHDPVPGDDINDVKAAKWMRLDEAWETFLPVHQYILHRYIELVKVRL